MSDRLFDYDAAVSLDVRTVGTRTHDDWIGTELTYCPLPDRRRAAYVVQPTGESPHAGLLYVHWYEPAAPTSNRTEFFSEAQTMAQRGAVSLLIEAPWSDREWFLKRTQADDYRASIDTVIELRRAMDLLLVQPGVDAKRVGYVGHDFGAMYGVIMGSVDPRPCCYVLMAGTPRLSDWFLYYPQLAGAAREAYVESMRDLDPIRRIASLAPAPLLFQFGEEDRHVPVARAEAFFQAAGQPRQLTWYDAGHELGERATSDRVAWVSERLDLCRPPGTNPDDEDKPVAR